MSEIQFWKPKPREPQRDWRTFSMLGPIIVSAFGFFVSGIFAFSFSDIGVIRPTVQSWLVIVSSGMIVWGAELNTPGTVIEVFRKILRKEANAWDIWALILSLLGTMVNLLVTFASRSTLAPTWQTFVLNWGPIVSGLTVAADYYGGLVETGFLFASYEMRMESWLDEKRQFDIDNGNVVERASSVLEDRIADLESKIEQLSWPVVTKAEYLELVAGMNGETPRTIEQASGFLVKHKRQMPNPRTAVRWGLEA